MRIEIPTKGGTIILDDFIPICLDFFERIEKEMAEKPEHKQEGRKDDTE
jgi:hypothetical protein